MARPYVSKEEFCSKYNFIMILIRITQKLQKELGIKAADIEPDEIPAGAFQEWYAHVFILDRKKQVIFVETQTLFSFCVSNLSRKDIRERFAEIFEKGRGYYSKGEQKKRILGVSE